MIKHLHTIRITFIILFLYTLQSVKVSAQTPADTIPKFIFYNLDDTPFVNRNLATGKKIVFVLFDVNCEHCQQTIRTLNTRFKECENLSIYLVSKDNRVFIKNFMERFGSNLVDLKNVTALQDMRNQFIKQFSPRKYPSLFLYSTEQKLILYTDDDPTLNKFFETITDSSKK